MKKYGKKWRRLEAEKKALANAGKPFSAAKRTKKARKKKKMAKELGKRISRGLYIRLRTLEGF